MGQFITAHSHYEVGVWEQVLGLHESASMAGVEQVKDAVCIDSDWSVNWGASAGLSDGELLMGGTAITAGLPGEDGGLGQGPLCSPSVTKRRNSCVTGMRSASLMFHHGQPANSADSE